MLTLSRIFTEGLKGVVFSLRIEAYQGVRELKGGIMKRIHADSRGYGLCKSLIQERAGCISKNESTSEAI